MEKEIFKQRYQSLDKQIKELEDAKRSLKFQFLEEYTDFCVGDKVKVFSTNFSGRERFVADAFINAISVSYDGDPKFSFLAVKKDGTPSAKGIGYIYSADPVRLELLSKAPNPEVSDTTDAQ